MTGRNPVSTFFPDKIDGTESGIAYLSEKKRGTEYGDVPFKFLLTVPNNNLMTDLYISFCFSVLFVVCIITVS